MAPRTGLVLGLLAVGLVTGTAGLGLAQDQNQVANAVAAPDQPAPTPPPASSAPANTVAAPPVQETPAPLALPPVEASSAPAAPSNTTASNAVANAVAEAPPPPPDKRPGYPVVVLQALDKATAETLRFEAKVGEPIRYKDLVIVPHACQTQAADEPYAQTAAHLDVQFQPADQPLHGQTVARQVFSGWMFGDAPGLHPFEHPTYDLWVIACKTSAPAPAAPVAGAHL